MGKRKITQISRIQPLQRDTAKVIPNSYVLGGLKQIIDVIGTAFGALLTVNRVSDVNAVYDGTYRFTCTGTGKFKVTNLDTNVTSAEYNASSSEVTVKDIYGIEVKVASGLTGVTEGDIVDVEIIGDSTYIVPGTILGRIKDSESDNFGKFEPIGSDLTKYDILRVCGGTIETNKQNFVAPVSDVTNNADNYTVDVYVFAQVIEEVCRAINLTDDAKKRIEGIVWE